jgi:hypothetical protein
MGAAPGRSERGRSAGSGRERDDAFEVVVGSLFGGMAAGEVGALAEPVGPGTAVGLAAEVERHQREELVDAGEVGEDTGAVLEPALDLGEGIFDRRGRVRVLGVAGRCLVFDQGAVVVDPAQQSGERAVGSCLVRVFDRVDQGLPAVGV